jgi:hypothetical protein
VPQTPRAIIQGEAVSFDFGAFNSDNAAFALSGDAFGSVAPAAVQQAAADTKTNDSPGSFGSGALQAAIALGLGYVSKRADVDIQQRVAQTGTVQRPTDQSPVTSANAAAAGTRPVQVSIPSFNLAGMMPWLVVGALALLVLRK